MVRLFTSKAKTEEELAVEFPEFAHELTEHVSVVMTRKTEMIMKGIKKNFEIIFSPRNTASTTYDYFLLYLFIDFFLFFFYSIYSNNSIEIISIQYPKPFSPSFETRLYYPEERNSNERKSFERKN